VTSLADAVVLVVSRGTSRQLAAAATAHLRSLGAPLAGIVFNRARSGDVRVYSYTPGRSRESRGSERAPLLVGAATERSPLGPVAWAVAQGTGTPAPTQEGGHRKRGTPGA
jgi:Mrp family chromosome partitioning ATPase